jgi:tRNA A37 methylthiotransferase MiaB
MSMNPRKIFFAYNKICIRRVIDSIKLSRFFKSNKYLIVDNPEDTDYIIVVTCANKIEEEEESLSIIKNLKKYNKKMIVYGCLPGISPKKLEEIHKGDKIAVKDINLIEELFPDIKIKLKQIDENFSDLNSAERSLIKKYEPLLTSTNSKERIFKKFLFYFRFNKNFFKRTIRTIKLLLNDIFRSIKNLKKTAYILRISYGCISKCSYCSIRDAVGKLKSKSIDDCKKEYIQAIKNGYRTFEFIGDDLGSYGLDINKSLPILLDELSKVYKKNDVEWIIQEINPRWLIKYYREIKEHIKNKITFISCPIQSGSPKVLRNMNRYSDIKKLKQMVTEIKKYNPLLLFITHTIIGFPGESKTDFIQTIKLVTKINFDEVHTFRYSDRENTISSHFENKISEKEITKRTRIFIKEMKKSKIICKSS